MCVAATADSATNAALSKWQPLQMPYHSAGLSVRERQMVEKLVEASRYLESIFWRQSDPEGIQLYKTTADPALKRLLMIHGCPWDLLNENRPFIGGQPMPPGHALYPKDLTRGEIEQYVKQHPADKAAIYDPYTVVERRGGRLVGVPYHEAYKEFVEPMSHALREAADLSDDPAFARFLRLRADALRTDDYYASDIAWLELENPKFDVIFAPYETYLDDLLGVKTSYGAAVLIRNDAESHKLAEFQKYVPEIQDALPLPPEDRPSKRGHATPMEVVDAPYRAGDLRHGYQAVADNLPNDPRVHQEKGSKKIFFKNFMDARVEYIILPLARRLMAPEQAAKASAEGYLTGTLLHEIAHGLGPSFARQGGRQVDIREAIGGAYSALEEAKADAVGMFGVAWLAHRGALPGGRLEEYYVSYVADLFRTLRFGTGEAHARAEMMEFNFLYEQKAIVSRGGRYAIDTGRMPEATAALAKELLEIEAAGDRARAERWFARYDQMPPAMAQALAAIGDVPVDIDPIFSFADPVR
ncbi:MAG TPA: hypothetical protein VMI94_27355 [Bryobacteraceae bacterium]|nr:hypothetical protein [Bryobacteraceae bacterium]